MRRIDYHVHTSFSADSTANPRQHVLQAIARGLDEICFTDHQDFCYPNTSFDLEVEPYLQAIQQLQQEFVDKITIKWGIEVGLDRHHRQEIETLLASYPFDFVIGSIHVIDNTEFYDPATFFDDKTKAKAHREFFEETLACVREFNGFNVLGHLDYIVRYGPYEDKSIDYQSVQDIIDEILKTLVAKKIGLEVNTSGYGIHKTCGFPNFEIIKRYYDLGGRILTIGSDSHTSNRVGEHIDEVIAHYLAIGFEDVTTFTKQKIDKPVK